MSGFKLVSVRFAKELLTRLDETCEKKFLSRSDYIRQAVIEKMNGEVKEA